MGDFSEILIMWFKENARKLPWRETKNPYYVYLSEIILQQTRVLQGLNYFLKIIKKFPTIQHLACAKIDDLLYLWQGLGYYSRARNMHKTAQIIVNEFNGNFPNSISDLISLPGVGKYTAAAVGSISFNLPEPAIDGNALRVFSRIWGIYEPINVASTWNLIYQQSKTIISQSNPGDFNQAIMEIGATVCLPKPACEHCPLNQFCFAFKNQVQNKIPVKIPKKKQSIRYFHYLIVIEQSTTKKQSMANTYITQRVGAGIWQGLYEFPLLEFDQVVDDLTLKKNTNKRMISGAKFTMDLAYECKHILTHQFIFAKFWIIRTKNAILVDSKELVKIPVDSVIKYPTHQLNIKFLNQINLKSNDK